MEKAGEFAVRRLWFKSDLTTQRLPLGRCTVAVHLCCGRRCAVASRPRESALLACGRFGDEGEVDVFALTASQVGEGDLVSHVVLAYLGDQGQGSVDGVAVYGGDGVACL